MSWPGRRSTGRRWAGAFDGLARGNQGTAGAILAGASLLKAPLALFLPYFVWRGNLRAAIAMSLCAACARAASVAIFGTPLHGFWFREFVVKQGVHPDAAYNVRSVNGFLPHLMTREHLRDWYPVDAGARFVVLSALLSAALTAAVAIACWQSGPPRNEAARRAETLAGALPHRPDRSHCVDALRSAVVNPGRRAPRAVRLPLFTIARRPGGRARADEPALVLSLQSRVGKALYERLLVSHYVAGAVILLGVLVGERLKIARADAAPVNA
ncbi:MAG: glycosyltransferase 87 family protein [Vicinamibacterales bacterium]